MNQGNTELSYIYYSAVKKWAQKGRRVGVGEESGLMSLGKLVGFCKLPEPHSQLLLCSAKRGRGEKFVLCSTYSELQDLCENCLAVR